MNRNSEDEKGIKGFISEEQFQQPQRPVNHETLVERIIQDAIAAGKLDNLAGEGKPLKVEQENPYIPEDMRLAYQILSRGGYAPPWVDQEKEVNLEIEQVKHARDEHSRWVIRRLDDIKQGPLQYFMRDLRQLSASHERWLVQHENRLQQLNEKIYSFNHICPTEDLLKVPIHVAHTMEEYIKSCPTIPQV